MNNNGIIVCDKCDGRGVVFYTSKNGVDLNNSFTAMKTCSKCRATGELDWIENIVGKKVALFDYKKYIKEVKKYRNECGMKEEKQ